MSTPYQSIPHPAAAAVGAARPPARIEALLLGLYDDDGKLNFVGRARVDDEAQAHAKLAPIVGVASR
jgi:hypothetical protein